jgi:hypothetical protein
MRGQFGWATNLLVAPLSDLIVALKLFEEGIGLSVDVIGAVGVVTQLDFRSRQLNLLGHYRINLFLLGKHCRP